MTNPYRQVCDSLGSQDICFVTLGVIQPRGEPALGRIGLSFQEPLEVGP